ncbi:hypothetical protein OROHE_003927 [Orobanche hederae]
MESSSKRSEPRNLDRLSELPDSLILNIFEFLPMNDVVSTQILSRRCKNLWITTPYLHFDCKSAADCDKFRHFVSLALLCWSGKRIQKFKLSNLTFSDKSLISDVVLWVRFAVDNGVEELETTSFKFTGNLYTDSYRVPNCLYSCSSLQKLSFLGDVNGINGNLVQWNQLKWLKLLCLKEGTQDEIDLVLSGIPMLEVFEFIFIQDNNSSLNFRSNSLKALYVYMSMRHKDGMSKDTELRIWTPNLEILDIRGGTSKIHHVWVTRSQIIPTMRHVKGLTLTHHFIQILGFEACKGLIPPSMSVVFLSLYGSFEEHIYTVGLLEILPKLKKLVIVDHESKYVDPNRKSFKPNSSKPFLVELRTVDITWNTRDFSIFPLIEIMLRCASKLEKMVFRVKRTVPPSELILTSQTKLLRMPRSSPNAELICEI